VKRRGGGRWKASNDVLSSSSTGEKEKRATSSAVKGLLRGQKSETRIILGSLP